MVLTVLSAVFMAPWSRAQVGTEPRGAWTEVVTDPASPPPPPREHAAVAFEPDPGGEPGRGRVVLFGGVDGNGNRLQDTWIWDGNSWRQAEPAERPSPRSGAVMAFDGTRLVLFGGDTGAGAVDDDLYFWDGARETWVGVPPSHRPERRRDASMVYDQRSNRLVLFGGAVGFQVLNDTWLWDGTSQTWSEVIPAADPSGAPPAAPAGRWDAAMAFDAHSDARHVVLFGGRDGTQDLNDTWIWNGATWSARQTPAELSVRSEAAMTFDPKAKSVVLFGGRQRFPAAPGQTAPPQDRWLNDTWLWDGTTWVDASPTSPPPPRSGAAIAPSPVEPTAPTRPQVLRFGGRADAADGLHNDTWLWDGTAPVPVSSTTTSTTTPSTSSTTSTTVAGRQTSNGFGTPPAPANTGGQGGGSGSAPLVDGGAGGGGGEGSGNATPTGGAGTGSVNNPGAFEGTPGADGSFGFFPGAAGTPGLEGAAAVTGAAAAPPPPIPAGAGPPPPPEPGFALQGGNPNSAPVGAAAPGSGAAPRAAGRFLMGTDNPAALGTLAGAALMFGLFCFRVARRPRLEPAPAWASGA